MINLKEFENNEEQLKLYLRSLIKDGEEKLLNRIEKLEKRVIELEYQLQNVSEIK